MEHLYQCVKDHLVNKIGDLKHVDLFNRQFEKIKLSWNEEIPIDLPAVLIEFVDLPWQTTKEGLKTTNALIRFHIGVWLYQESHSGSSDETAALNKLAYRKKVIKELQGLQGDSFTALQHINTGQDTDHTNIFVWTEDFTTTIRDDSAYEKQDWKDVTPGLNVEKDITTQQQ